jgi:hypothetical protein
MPFGTKEFMKLMNLAILFPFPSKDHDLCLLLLNDDEVVYACTSVYCSRLSRKENPTEMGANS